MRNSEFIDTKVHLEITSSPNLKKLADILNNLICYYLPKLLLLLNDPTSQN